MPRITRRCTNSRVRRGVLVALVGVMTATLMQVATSTARAELKIPVGRFALGDSVMLGAKAELKSVGFGVVDADESRQAYSGPAELRRRGGSLPTNVVLHLGTNGTFPLPTCKSMVRTAGDERRIFLVTVHVPRSWAQGNNKVIRRCAASFPPGRVIVIDWDRAAARHDNWLYSDRTHLRPAGARASGRIIH